MSQLSQDAHAVVLIADYIAIEGKVHAVGLGFTATLVQPSGLTAPQFVAAIIDLPAKYVGQQCAVSFELRDEATGSTVQVPGDRGQREALRVQQVMTVQAPGAAGLPIYLPPDLPARLQAVLGFSNGLPLEPGRSYYWRLEIDGDHRKPWRAGFHVVGPPPGPVFGGPVGPAEIPNLPPPPSEPAD